MNRRTVVPVIALALTLSACGSARADGPPEVHQGWESCAAVVSPEELQLGDVNQQALNLPQLDDEFRPVAAVLCAVGPQNHPDGSSDLVFTEERAGDVARLVETLRLEDEDPTSGFCTQELPFVPWLVLLDEQGRWIRPGVPVDECRKPNTEFGAAVEQLKTERVSSRLVRVLESAGAVAAGCSQTRSDEVLLISRDEPGSGTAPVPALDAGDGVRACLYRKAERERDHGEFESGGPLSGQQWTAVRNELGLVRPAAACTTPAERFAVLHLSAGFVYVEGGGCGRVLFVPQDGPAAVRQGSAELTTLLFGR